MVFVLTLALLFSEPARSTVATNPTRPSSKDGGKLGFIEKVLTDEEGDHRYVVFVPHAYTPDKKWPIMLFLHGSGERGTDNTKQIRVGLAPAIREREADFPFIVVFPQCEDPRILAPVGWKPPHKPSQLALAMLAATEAEYATDPDRVILTGLSMGGFGTWALAAEDPDRWAAIVPICGGGNPENAAKIVDIPCWCFHGGMDTVVPPRFSRSMVEALRAGGGTPKYTEYPEEGHKSWRPAYDTDELYTWLLEQRRSARKTRPNTTLQDATSQDATSQDTNPTQDANAP